MIVAPVQARFVASDARLDAHYHCSPGVQAAEAMVLLKAKGVLTVRVAGKGGLGVVQPTTRTKRVYAGPGEDAVPYLRPYDVFDFLPQPADMLASTSAAAALKPPVGTILQTCSGRNLGPSAIVDSYLARFAVSDDMLRLRIEDARMRYYVSTFLSTPTGQALLTRNKTGGVIDHLSAADLGAVEVPLLSEDLISQTSDKIAEVIRLRETARVGIDMAVKEYEASISSLPDPGVPCQGWTVRAGDLDGRLDAARYMKDVQTALSDLLTLGGPRVDAVANVNLPGRYTRYYVSSEFGRPIVSGRQLLQATPVNLKYLSSRSLDFDEFELRAGMVAFGAEGRAEDRIAVPVMITSDRAGWLANNHVMRVEAKDGISPGWLFLSFSTSFVQLQVRAMACGSVVDSVYPVDLRKIVLPPMREDAGKAVESFWEALSKAGALEQEAIDSLETALMKAAL